MKPVVLPKNYNYIEAYLTYNCNMSCSYCLNHYHTLVSPKPMSTKDWITALGRISAGADLPITLGGGEPTLYPGFYDVVESLPNGTVDLLTNGLFDVHEFMEKVSPDKFKRDAKYASIRFSLHIDTPLKKVLTNMFTLKRRGYSVGMWAVNYPPMGSLLVRIHDICMDQGVDFRVKDFLGYFKNKLYGEYKYPSALGKPYSSTVMCKSSELLIAPDGEVFRCHSDLYAHRLPIGHILRDISFRGFDECANFGQCHPCDIKLKYDRFQVHGHCSIEIKKPL